MSRGTYSVCNCFQQNVNSVFVLRISLLRVKNKSFQSLEEAWVVQVIEISLDPVVNEH